MDLGNGVVGIDNVFEQDFNLVVVVFLVEKMGFDDVGVVEDQQVVGFEQCWQVGKLLVGKLLIVDMQ